MNIQEIFNLSVSGVYKQGHAAVQEGTGKCLYHAPNGDKCAVGQLIPHTVDTRKIDNYNAGGVGVDAPPVKEILKSVGVLGDNSAHNDSIVALLTSLQSAHDGASHHRSDSAFLNEWMEETAKVATAHNLTPWTPEVTS